MSLKPSRTIQMSLSAALVFGFVAIGFSPVPAAIRNCGTWVTVKTAPTKAKAAVFSQVVAVSAKDAWAVGYTEDGHGGSQEPLVEQWTGSKWHVSGLSPVKGGGTLTSVVAFGSNDVWTAGSRAAYGDAGGSTIAEHWNGFKWESTPTPHINGGAPVLTALVGLSPKEVWAFGDIDNSGSSYQPIAEEWDGSSWKLMDLPNHGSHGVQINGATAISSKAIWAVGATFTDGHGPGKAVTEVWNGSGWGLGGAPDQNGVALSAAAVPSLSDAWVAGQEGSASDTHYFVSNWDGKSWTTESAPPAPHPSSTVTSMFMSSPSSGWMVGYSVRPRPTAFDSMIARWNGKSWSSQGLPGKKGTTLLFGVGSDATDGAWAVGSGGQAAPGSPLALRFKSCSSST